MGKGNVNSRSMEFMTVSYGLAFWFLINRDLNYIYLSQIARAMNFLSYNKQSGL